MHWYEAPHVRFVHTKHMSYLVYDDDDYWGSIVLRLKDGPPYWLICREIGDEMINDEVNRTIEFPHLYDAERFAIHWICRNLEYAYNFAEKDHIHPPVYH